MATLKNQCQAVDDELLRHESTFKIQKQKIKEKRDLMEKAVQKKEALFDEIRQLRREMQHVDIELRDLEREMEMHRSEKAKLGSQNAVTVMTDYAAAKSEWLHLQQKKLELEEASRYEISFIFLQSLY
jgi:hypothetical protein